MSTTAQTPPCPTAGANRANLAGFVSKAIEQANGRSDGQAHLARNIERLEGYCRDLIGPGATPSYLVGLSAFDLAGALGDLHKARLALADGKGVDAGQRVAA